MTITSMAMSLDLKGVISVTFTYCGFSPYGGVVSFKGLEAARR